MVVPENTGGIIGKILLLLPGKHPDPQGTKFIRVGMDFGLPKFKPAKESKAGAYRNATTALKERIEVKGQRWHSSVSDLYCRDNKKGGLCAYLSGTGEGNPERPVPTSTKKLANIVF